MNLDQTMIEIEKKKTITLNNPSTLHYLIMNSLNGQQGVKSGS